jgi:uncharacterized membrane protein
MTKTLTFAVMHFTVAFSVAYLISGSFLVGGLVAIIEPAINTVAYYFHEKFWQSFKQGKSRRLETIVSNLGESYALKS